MGESQEIRLKAQGGDRPKNLESIAESIEAMIPDLTPITEHRDHALLEITECSTLRGYAQQLRIIADELRKGREALDALPGLVDVESPSGMAFLVHDGGDSGRQSTGGVSSYCACPEDEISMLHDMREFIETTLRQRQGDDMVSALHPPENCGPGGPVDPSSEAPMLLPNGNYLVVPSYSDNPEGCDYVRIVSDMTENGEE